MNFICMGRRFGIFMIPKVRQYIGANRAIIGVHMYRVTRELFWYIIRG